MSYNNLTFLVLSFDFPSLGYGVLVLIVVVVVICFFLFGFYPRMKVLPALIPLGTKQTNKQAHGNKTFHATFNRDNNNNISLPFLRFTGLHLPAGS